MFYFGMSWKCSWQDFMRSIWVYSNVSALWIISIVNTWLSTSLWALIRRSVSDTMKTPPSVPPPTRDSSVHLSVFWWRASRCVPGISQTLVRFVVALRRPAEKKDAFPLQCVLLLLYVVRERVEIKVELNSDPRRILSVQWTRRSPAVSVCARPTDNKPFYFFSNYLYKGLNCVYAL